MEFEVCAYEVVILFNQKRGIGACMTRSTFVVTTTYASRVSHCLFMESKAQPSAKTNLDEILPMFKNLSLRSITRSLVKR